MKTGASRIRLTHLISVAIIVGVLAQGGWPAWLRGVLVGLVLLNFLPAEDPVPTTPDKRAPPPSKQEWSPPPMFTWNGKIEEATYGALAFLIERGVDLGPLPEPSLTCRRPQCLDWWHWSMVDDLALVHLALERTGASPEALAHIDAAIAGQLDEQGARAFIAACDDRTLAMQVFLFPQGVSMLKERGLAAVKHPREEPDYPETFRRALELKAVSTAIGCQGGLTAFFIYRNLPGLQSPVPYLRDALELGGPELLEALAVRARELLAARTAANAALQEAAQAAAEAAPPATPPGEEHA